MNCRGPRRREEIVRNYNIECVAHIRLLNGRIVRSDAERNITRTYYLFICTNIENPTIVEQICCGEGAGTHLLRLAGITAPPIFNMLHGEHNDGGNGGGNGNNPRIVWNAAAKQLYDAIMILITAWDLQPGPIFDYLRDARRYHYCTPYAHRIERINSILRRHNTSMRMVINNLAENNDLRDYQFDLLENILRQGNIISYFEDANGR